MIKAIVVILLMSVAATLSIDYCLESLCDGAPHIACKNNGTFGEACPSNAVVIPFTDKLKELAVNTQNFYRDQVARGKVKGYKNAARMATLVWNDELAKLAEYNVRTCIFGHDKCRNTVRFKYAGQNLGQMKNSKKFPKPEVAIKTITKGWFSENINGNMNVIDSFQHLDKMIGHYTQIVRDEAFAVGCAIVQFKEPKWHVTLYGCDYTLTNINGYPIYETSSKTASKCKTVNPTLPGLCSTKEIYDNDMFYNRFNEM